MSHHNIVYQKKIKLFVIMGSILAWADSSYILGGRVPAPGVKDVQGSLPRAISDTDRNLGIKLTVCLHFAPPVKTIKRSFPPQRTLWMVFRGRIKKVSNMSFLEQRYYNQERRQTTIPHFLTEGK